MSLPSELLPVGLLGTGEAAAERIDIERSVRFNSSDSAYLSRTPASAGNRKTWTWAGWVKRSSLGNSNEFFTAADPSGNQPRTSFKYNSGDNLIRIDFNPTGLAWITLLTTAVFRDLSAWYHIVLSVDTTQVTDTDRTKLYVNGVQQTLTGTYVSPNTDLPINGAYSHVIGSYAYSLSGYFDGYLADIHFIDGAALDPTSFGEFDANGIWQPIEYTGSYNVGAGAVNGFHLDFSDNSTAAALGTDTSGAGNDWTVNNISVAAGAGNDSLVDVPTNGTETDTGVGGEVRGNYATFNPFRRDSFIGGLSNGNLDVRAQSTSQDFRPLSTIGVSSGKWYWEVTKTCTASFQIDLIVGIANLTASASTYSPGSFRNDPINTLYGVSLDFDTLTFTVKKNNAAHYSTSITADTYFAYVNVYNAGAAASASVNFGQRPFAYTAPSGFKALCTANLPAPTIEDPSTVMDVALYTGNGSTQTISGLDFSPDLVWIKNRAAADSHKLTDTIRGATEELESDTTAAEATNADGLTQFNSDGFDLGADAEYNTNTETYVAWCWDAGSSTVTNTDGSISSQVRANASAGFSIASYAGSGANATFGHSLGVAPQFVIVKNRTVAGNIWAVYHKDVGATKWLKLSGTDSEAVASTIWNNTAPSSSVVHVGTSSAVNASGSNYIAYCFAPVDGYSSFGSYTGNGSADGPFVYTGMRPRWILIKQSSAAGEHWLIRDTARDTFNVMGNRLMPSSNNQEDSGAFQIDALSNGFKIRSNSATQNSSGATYIYAAFAENPFALNARAR